MTNSGRRPNPSTYREWLLAAEPLAAEDEIPMIDKEALRARIEATREAILETESAEVDLRERENALKGARARAERAIRRTAILLKAALIEEDTTNQRRTMRTYGYRFEGETETEEIETTTN